MNDSTKLTTASIGTRTALLTGVSTLAFALACSSNDSSPAGTGGTPTGGEASAVTSDTGGTVTGGTVTGGTVTGGTVTGGTVTGGTSGGTTTGGTVGTVDGSGGATSTSDAGTTTGVGGATTTGGGGSGGTTGPDSVGLVPGTQNYNCDPPEGEMPVLQLTPWITSGLDLPILITHAPNELDRLFVVEQNGKIKVIRDSAVNAEAFLDITGSVSIDPWEQGLLGLAFHPDFAENGLFYIHYNALGVSGVPDQANVVSEFKVSADNPDVADPGSERMLVTLDTDRQGQYQGYHNGGAIFLGLEGELFMAFGDGAGRGPGEAANNSQDVTSLRGTLSRIIPEANGDQPYSIPAGNLSEEAAMIGGQAVAPEIWSYGLRNPFRATMDACTGDIYYGDVGHFDWEEVDVEPAGSGHHNYGWPVYEGDSCLLGNCSDPERYRAPFVAYSHNGGSGAVIGGAVYRGSAIPALRGTYFFSDLYGGTKAFRYDSSTDSIVINGDGSVEEETNATQTQQTLVAIQNGGDGELYFVGRGGSTDPNGPSVGSSVIYKLEPYGGL